MSTDKEKAELLLDALKDESHMCYSSDYQKLVEEISQYRRLTKKDLSIMIDFEEVLRVEDHLENGHLNDLYVLSSTLTNKLQQYNIITCSTKLCLTISPIASVTKVYLFSFEIVTVIVL